MSYNISNVKANMFIKVSNTIFRVDNGGIQFYHPHNHKCDSWRSLSEKNTHKAYFFSDPAKTFSLRANSKQRAFENRARKTIQLEASKTQ